MSTQRGDASASSDSDETTDCRTAKSYSPKRKSLRSSSSRSDTSDYTIRSCRSVEYLPPFKGYPTRTALKKHRRKHRQKIKICEGDNEVKNFYKRRMIPTDFQFNPRFDKPKRKRDSKLKEEYDSVLFVTEGSTHDLSEETATPKKILKVKGILKPNPLKQPLF